MAGGPVRASRPPRRGRRPGAAGGRGRAPRERGGERLEWAALDWNELALGFYRRLGARTMNEWITHRLDGEALAALAERSGEVSSLAVPAAFPRPGSAGRGPSAPS